MFNRIKEELDKGFFIPWVMFKKNLQAGFAFFIVTLKHPVRYFKDVISAWKLRLKAKKPLWASISEHQINYITPKQLANVTYEDIQRATHNTKYLRPTRLCKPNSPEIVALAKELGAWRKSDWDYAESIFNFMKNVEFAFGPLKSEIEVLNTNHGVCLDQQSLAIALARAGGIPSRYSLTGLIFTPTVRDAIAVDPTFREAYNTLGVWEQHGAAEFMIDGKWVVTDVTFSESTVVGMGIPLPHFGNADVGLGIKPPELITSFEGFPWGYSLLMKVAMIFMRGMADRINANIAQITERGQKILEEIGREKYIEQTSKIAAGKNFTELPSLNEVEEFKRAKLPK
jgi:hypothetical protein